MARCTARPLSAVVLAVVCLSSTVSAQIPNEFRNLQVLPKDITRDSLVQIMRSFSLGTGLRCEDCHVLGPNDTFENARFDLDDKALKLRGRWMLEMVLSLNERLRHELPDGDGPPLVVECKTCHRGIRKPYLLRTELREVVETEGVEAAVSRYRELRDRAGLRGVYDFGEWEMNELARELARAGHVTAAITMLELNEEFHASSSAIPAMLGRYFEQGGQRDAAIAAYRRAVERNPDDRISADRLRALTGG